MTVKANAVKLLIQYEKPLSLTDFKMNYNFNYFMTLEI